MNNTKPENIETVNLAEIRQNPLERLVIRRLNKELKKDGLRKCSICLGTKNITEFYGGKGNCKNCFLIKCKKKYILCADLIKKRAAVYHRNNRDKILIEQRKYRKNNRKKLYIGRKKTVEKRKEYYNEMYKKYRKEHKQKHLEYCNLKVKQLSDWYVRNLILKTKGGGRILHSKDIPQEMVDVKRLQINIIREKRQWKQKHLTT